MRRTKVTYKQFVKFAKKFIGMEFMLFKHCPRGKLVQVDCIYNGQKCALKFEGVHWCSHRKGDVYLISYNKRKRVPTLTVKGLRLSPVIYTGVPK